MVCVIWIVWEGVWGYGAGMDLIGRLEDIPVLEAGQVVVWGGGGFGGFGCAGWVV